MENPLPPPSAYISRYALRDSAPVAPPSPPPPRSARRVSASVAPARTPALASVARGFRSHRPPCTRCCGRGAGRGRGGQDGLGLAGISSGESGESVKGGSGRGAHHVVGAGERRERIAQYPRPKLAHGLVGADQVGRPRAGAHPAEHLTAHSKCDDEGAGNDEQQKMSVSRNYCLSSPRVTSRPGSRPRAGPPPRPARPRLPPAPSSPLFS